MNKKLIIGIGIAVVVIGGIFLLSTMNNEEGVTVINDGITREGDGSFKGISYVIGGTTVDLVDGEAQTEVDGTMLITKYYGNEIEEDLNEDGKPDIAFLLTQESTGTTTYHIAAALQTDGGYKGTTGASLGDDITPVSVETDAGRVVVNYRKGTAATSTSLSTRYFAVINEELVGVSE